MHSCLLFGLWVVGSIWFLVSGLGGGGWVTVVPALAYFFFSGRQGGSVTFQLDFFFLLGLGCVRLGVTQRNFGQDFFCQEVGGWKKCVAFSDFPFFLLCKRVCVI